MKNILEHVAELSHEKKVELLGVLKAALAEELSCAVSEKPKFCPRCGCDNFVKRGRDVDGGQRWLCHGCARTFSVKSAALLANSKLDAGTWMEFAACMADSLTLRDTAIRCGTSLYTAWFMRMRVCEVMARRLVPARKGTFHIDDTHLVENLSGNHIRSVWFDMPRKAHRNGQDGRHSARSCRSKGRVAISCGINEYGDSFCELAAQGAPSAIEEQYVLGDKIPPGSTIVSDGDLSCAAALAREGYSHTIVNRYGINMVNALHSRLKAFLVRFKGVSTRRLQRYLDWFCYIEQFKGSDTDRRELLFTHEAEGSYAWTRRITHREMYPFIPYYDRRRYAAMTRQISMVV